MSKPDSERPIQPIAFELRNAQHYGQSGQWSDADVCFRSAVSLDHSPASRIAFANSLANRERYNESICLLTEALDLANETGDRAALGVIFHNLAGIYRELDDNDLARRFQHRAVLQLDDCGPLELLGLANDAWLSRRVDLASCLSASCIDLEDDESDDSISLEAQAMLATITGLEENPREGIRTLILVYRRHHVINAHRLMGIDLLNMSVLLSQLGKYRTEIIAVQRSISHFEQAPAPISASRGIP